MARSRRALGRGLKTLISEKPPSPDAPAEEADAAGLMDVPLEAIDPSPWQPRQTFDADRLEELAHSIREQGLVQPLVVRRRDGRYEVIAGERRLRAVRSLGWKRVPVVVMEAGDARMRELALVENLQRDDLDPIETGLAYQALQKELGLTHERIAERLGVSRSAITNTLRLLELPDEVRRMVVAGELSPGHGRALLALPDDLSRLRLARRAVEQGLTVREVEKAVQPRRPAAETKPGPASAASGDPAVRHLEERLAAYLQTKVRIEDRGGEGRIQIHYYSHDDATRLLERIGLPPEI